MEIISSKSSYVDSQIDNNYGSSGAIQVMSWSFANQRSFIEFDISNKPSTINKVLLWLYCFNAPSYTRTHDAERITSSWNESTIKWSLQPTTTSTNKASRTATSSDNGKWVSWDITNLFGDETGSTLGIRIKDSAENFSNFNEWDFRSDDYSNSSYRPKIEINGYYVKVGGNDGLSGLSWANAWATINKAATTIPDGSTIHIGFGDYILEPSANKIAPQNIGSFGIEYLPETATTGGGTGTVSIEQNP